MPHIALRRWTRQGPCMFGAAGVLAIAAAVPAQTRLAFTVIALSDQTAPGTQQPFGALTLPPSISTLGQVAWSHSAGVWSYDTLTGVGPFLLAATGAPVIGGSPGDVWRPPFLCPLLDREARIAGLSTVGSSTYQTGIVHGRPGSFHVAARANHPVPGYGGGMVFQGDYLRRPVMNPAGAVAFEGRIQGVGSGVWAWAPGEHTQLVLGPLKPAPDFPPGVQVYVAVEPRVNRAGHVLMHGGVSGPGVTIESDEVLYLGPPQAPRLVLREGESIGGSPPLDHITATSLNDSDHVAMWVGFKVPLTTQAIVSGPPGDLRVVAKSWESGPGMLPGERWGNTYYATHFWFPVMAGNDRVVFWGQIASLPEDQFGVWCGSADHLTLVVRSGMWVKGLPSDVVIAGPDGEGFTANGVGDVILRVGLAGPSVHQGNELAVLHWNEGVLRVVLRTGDRVHIPGGGARVIKTFSFAAGSGGQDGRAMSIDDAGHFAFNLKFTDDTTGVFVTTVH